MPTEYKRWVVKFDDGDFVSGRLGQARTPNITYAWFFYTPEVAEENKDRNGKVIPVRIILED